MNKIQIKFVGNKNGVNPADRYTIVLAKLSDYHIAFSMTLTIGRSALGGIFAHY